MFDGESWIAPLSHPASCVGCEISREGGTSTGQNSRCEISGWNVGGEEFRMWYTRMECRRRRIPDVRHPEKVGLWQDRIPDVRHPGKMERRWTEFRMWDIRRKWDFGRIEFRMWDIRRMWDFGWTESRMWDIWGRWNIGGQNSGCETSKEDGTLVG